MHTRKLLYHNWICFLVNLVLESSQFMSSSGTEFFFEIQAPIVESFDLRVVHTTHT